MSTRPPHDGISQANVAVGRLRNSRFAKVVYLLFGGCFMGIILILVSNEFKSPVSDILALSGGVFIEIVVLKRKLRPLRIYTFAWLAAIGGGLLAYMVFISLALLAAGGAFDIHKSLSGHFNAEIILLFGILWLLLGVPHRAFRYRLDQGGTGEAQRVLLGLLTAMAAILTGVSILMLHFGGGPLHGIVDIKLFITGIIFTVFLVVPSYRSLARAVWKHGIPKVFSLKPSIKHWDEATTELRKALNQYSQESRRERQASKANFQGGSDSRKYSSQQRAVGRASLPRNNSGQAKKKAEDAGDPQRHASGQRPAGGASPPRNNSQRTKPGTNARKPGPRKNARKH